MRTKRHWIRLKQHLVVGCYTVIEVLQEKGKTCKTAVLQCSACGKVVRMADATLRRYRREGTFDDCHCHDIFNENDFRIGGKPLALRCLTPDEKRYREFKKRFRNFNWARKHNGRIAATFSFDELISEIGLPEENTNDFYFELCVKDKVKPPLLPSDLFWKKKTTGSKSAELCEKTGLSRKQVSRRVQECFQTGDCIDDIKRKQVKSCLDFYTKLIGKKVGNCKIVELYKTDTPLLTKFHYRMKCDKCGGCFVREAYFVLRKKSYTCPHCKFNGDVYMPVQHAIKMSKNSSCAHGAILYQRMKKHICEDPVVKQIKENSIGFFTRVTGTEEFMNMCIDCDLMGKGELLREMFYIG